MVTDPRFDPEPTHADAPPQERKGCRSCMIGCLIVAVVLLVLMVIAGYWAYRNWRELAAAGTTAVVEQTVDATALPAEEKQEIMTEVERLSTAIRAGRVSAEQSVLLMQQIVESPFMLTLAVLASEKYYFDNSGLDEEEKVEGSQTNNRFMRGVIDEKIPQRSVEETFAHIADRQPDGSWEPREKVTDADLRAFLAAAKEAADKAEIPNDLDPIDPSEELKQIIDPALQQP